MKMISACLLGIRCDWSGDERYRNEQALRLLQTEILVPVCPEQLGGLPTPRPPQEIQNGSGEDVLDRRVEVFNTNNVDVTDHFIRGAEETLKIARRLNLKEFIGKSGSPSCGCGHIHDGSFSGMMKVGNGVTAALLGRHEIRLVPEEDL
jgi:uncharacterized protein YbbK (DUF523 family)